MPSSAQIFAMTPAGTNLGTYSTTGAGKTDWEDISIGPGPVANTQYIYVADIGDNNLARSTVAVYRVPEPSVSDTQTAVTTSPVISAESNRIALAATRGCLSLYA